MIGKIFGNLKVLSIVENDPKGRKRIECECECGNIKAYDFYKVKSGHTKSCGCKKNEYIAKARTTHNGRFTELYKKWCGIKRRCLNSHEKCFKNYGGRGITICNEWLDFKIFEIWAKSNGYKEDLTIERINVNEGYNPKNCKWITSKEQARNKTNTAYILYKNKLIPLQEIAEIEKINNKTLSSRYYRFIKRNPNINKENISFDMLIPR